MSIKHIINPNTETSMSQTLTTLSQMNSVTLASCLSLNLLIPFLPKPYV